MKYLFLIHFSLAFCFVASSQSIITSSTEQCKLECTYNLSYQPDSTDKAIRSEVMSLVIGKTLSKFESRGSQAFDSILAINENILPSQINAQELVNKMRTLPRSTFRYKVFKDSKTGAISYYDRIGRAFYTYVEPVKPFTWTLTPTTSTIAGYTCQKAITSFGGRVWDAWFTRTIPVAEGPYKFCGLPGLIIKISDQRNSYTFELIKLNDKPLGKTISLPDKKYIPTTKTSFKQALSDFNSDPISNISSSAGGVGEVFQNPDEARRKARELVKRRNNVLELK